MYIPLYIECYFANAGTGFAGLCKEDTVAVKVDNMQVLNHFVRVGTDNDIDVTRGGCQFHIGHLPVHGVVGALVAEADNDIAVLVVAEKCGSLLCRYDGVKVTHRGEVLGGNEAVRVHAYTEHAYPQTFLAEDSVGLHQSIQGGVAYIVVGTHDRELCHAQYHRQRVQAIVELVVAQCGGIVAHTVEGVHLDAPMVEIEIGRTLAKIAGIYQYKVRVSLTLALDETHTTRITCAVGITLARLDRLDLRVGVVGMQDGDSLLFRTVAGSTQESN